MKANTAFVGIVVLAGVALLLTLWGCGYGPIEQSRAIQAGALPVSAAIGEATDVPALMQKLRTEYLNLDDKLLSGDKNQITTAALNVSAIGDQVSKFQPAVKQTPESAQIFKRLAIEVKDMAIEIARTAEAGQMDYANHYFLQLRQRCATCHQYYRGVQGTSDDLDIPEIEVPTTPPDEPAPEDAGDAPAVLPEGGADEIEAVPPGD